MQKIKQIIFLALVLICTNVFGQQLPLRHSSVAGDGWLSCTPTANPNPARGSSHWIMYNLGNQYTLNTLRLWNFNHPDSLNSGIQNLQIDISTNGTTWNNIGPFTLAKANGSSFYEGSVVTNLNKKVVRYLLITATSNYGGSCYGLSEVKFDINQSALPVTIASFKIDCGDSEPSLIWEVKEESDIAGYVIEGSNDVENWSAVKKIPSSGSAKYQSNLSGGEANFTYYRLLIDEKNNDDWNSILVSNTCKRIAQNVVAWPNPAQESTSIKVDNLANYTGKIMLIDQRGALIKSFSNQKVVSQINLNLADVPVGQYFIVLQNTVADTVIPITKI